MEIILLFLSVAVTVFIGANIFYLIAPKGKLRLSEKIFLSYGAGLGFITLGMLVLFLFKKKFDLAIILVPWAVLLFVNALKYLKTAAGHPGKKRNFAHSCDERSLYLCIFLTCGLAFEVFYAFFRALIKPMESYDAVAIYGIKAKAFFLAKTIPQDIFHKLSAIFPHADYPLNIPLAETFTCLFLGTFNDQLVKVIFPMFFLATLGLVYFFIRRFAGRTYSLLFTFILATIPQFSAQATSGYIDVPLGYYASASMLFLFLWFKDTSETSFLWISAVMAGLGAWTKNEGLMYCAIDLVLLVVFFVRRCNIMPARRKVILFAAFMAIVLLINGPWLYVKWSEHLSNSEISLSNINLPNLAHNLARMRDIAYEFQKQFLGPKKWNIIWIAFFAVFVLKIRKAFKGDMLFISLALLLAFGGYKIVYLITSRDISWHLATSASRLLLHFLPIVVCWLAMALKEGIDI